jgi:hypothetical protein
MAVSQVAGRSLSGRHAGVGAAVSGSGRFASARDELAAASLGNTTTAKLP